MASRSRQRVQTGRTGGSPAHAARAPPSAHLRIGRATSKSAAREVLRSSYSRGPAASPIRVRAPSSSGGGAVTAAAAAAARRGRKPVARMPEVDLSDLHNEFFLPPKAEPWNKNAAQLDDSPARTLAELKEKRLRMRRPQVHKAVDIDGDGVIDEVEMELSKILDNIEGEDLDGDGIVTEEELNETKVRKGKELLARRFVQSHPGVGNFWSDFKGLDEETMVRQICQSDDYRMLMSNLQNKAMQFELLYDSSRIGDSLRIMATDRDRRWQQKKAQIASTRNRLFQAKYNATVNLHRQSRVAERQHERDHERRQRQSFTPMLTGPSFKQSPPR